METVAVPPSARPAAYRFEGFILDLVRGALFDPHGAELQLRPKAFFLLRHLVENAGQLIDRDEILAAVWPGVFVTDDSVTLCISELRHVLKDEAKRLVRTVPRRGYLFAAAVSRHDRAMPALPSIPNPSAAESAASSPVASPAASGQPVLVVLPFSNMTGDPEQDYFADGITEDLTTSLSHLRWFSVVARNSAFTYKGNAVDVREVGRQLGVGYVLEGSVRKAGSRVRSSAQLCAAETGRHVWADRFDGTLADIFNFRDRVTETVVGGIEPSLRSAELERIRTRPPASLTTYDLYLRAVARRYVSRNGSDEAQCLLRQAIALDPSYIVAQRLLTASLAQLGRVDEAAEAARVLLALAPGYTLADAVGRASTRDPVERQHFLDGLRKAGVPD